MSFLSQNLTWAEVLNGSGYEMHEVPKSVRGEMVLHAQTSWQPVREAWGGALIIVPGGGLRSPAKNKEIGGAAKSQHVIGCATDVKINQHRPNKEFLALYGLIDWMQRSKDIPQGGLALYWDFENKRVRFAHFDSRGHLARWNANHLKAAREYYST